jgi:hypothetical protein
MNVSDMPDDPFPVNGGAVLAGELAAKAPWLHAQEGSWWEVSGRVNPRHTFKDCLARVMPAEVTGVDSMPIFEVLTYGHSFMVNPGMIHRAREVFLVDAQDPLQAYLLRDQASIDVALKLRDADHERDCIR